MKNDNCVLDANQQKKQRPRYRELRIAIAVMMAVGVFYATFCWTRHIADPYFLRLDYFQRVNPKNLTETGRFLAYCLILVAPVAWGLATFYLFAAGVVSSTKPIQRFYCRFIDEKWVESKRLSRLSWLVYPGTLIATLSLSLIIGFLSTQSLGRGSPSLIGVMLPGCGPTAVYLLYLAEVIRNTSSSAYCRIQTVAGTSIALAIVAVLTVDVFRTFIQLP